jgi:hypothetical protein
MAGEKRVYRNIRISSDTGKSNMPFFTLSIAKTITKTTTVEMFDNIIVEKVNLSLSFGNSLIAT